MDVPADALGDLGGRQPHMLMPRPVERCQQAALERSLAGRRCAVGLTVPLADAAHSLRWALRALALSRAGVISGSSVTFCEDYLVELWLLADDALIEQLGQRWLGGLGELSPIQRQRLTETCGAALETGGTAPEMAERLQVHPQTVRYRMRKLHGIFGSRLEDPNARFAIEIVLRARRLRERASLDEQAPCDERDMHDDAAS